MAERDDSLRRIDITLFVASLFLMALVWFAAAIANATLRIADALEAEYGTPSAD